LLLVLSLQPLYIRRILISKIIIFQHQLLDPDLQIIHYKAVIHWITPILQLFPQLLDLRLHPLLFLLPLQRSFGISDHNPLPTALQLLLQLLYGLFGVVQQYLQLFSALLLVHQWFVFDTLRPVTEP
jgi:hypothetical protein